MSVERSHQPRLTTPGHASSRPHAVHAPEAAAGLARAAGARDLSWALPSMHRVGDRLLLRALALLATRHIVAIHGLEHIRPACDPFILVANHSTRREAILVPAMLFLHRGGRVVHFLADWNFQLIPGVGLIYSRAEVVTVTRKSARPRFLNVLKPLYGQRRSRWSAPKRCWPPAARSAFSPRARPIARPPSCCAGVAVPPAVAGDGHSRHTAGHPFSRRRPGATNSQKRSHGAAHWRTPAAAEPRGAAATMSEVSAWHSVIMTEIAQLSGKAWKGAAKEADP